MIFLSRSSPEAGADYSDSEPHRNTELAGRIIMALHGGRNTILVTGDPPASPRLLCDALTTLGAPSDAVIAICCGPKLTRSEIWRAATAVARSPETLKLETSQLPAVLFVFDNVGRLSNDQIKDIYEAIQLGDTGGTAAVLLASPRFLSRLTAPALSFLKDGSAGRISFQGLVKGESVELRRNRLVNPLRYIDVRGVSRFFIPMAVAAMAGIGALLLCRPVEQSGESLRRLAVGISSTGEASRARSMPTEMPNGPRPATWEHLAQQTPRGQEATSLPVAMAQLAQVLQSVPPSATADPAPKSRAEEPLLPKPTPQVSPPVALPASRPAAAEIAALVARGDSFLGIGDIASARMFYERAADAGDGAAALRLGATFDPSFLARAGMQSIRADPERAASWYRRARELDAPRQDAPTDPAQ